MTKAEIKEKIAKIEKGIASGQVSPDYIPDLEAKRDALKKQLEDMEEAEKPAAKPAAEAKATPAATPSALSGKSKSELESDIRDIKKAIAGTSNPKIKESLERRLGIFEAELDGREDDKKVDKLEKEAEKKIKAVEKVIASPKTPAKEKAVAKKKVEAIKKVVKEAKKDAEKDKVARRRGRPRKAEAAQKVAAKRGRPAKAAAKPAAAKAKPVKAAKKPVVKRKTKAVVKLQKAVSSLEKLVRRSKELRAMYAGKGIDLERDAGRGAKKPGWRLAGTNRRPTKADIKSRRAYYEARGNRADIQKSKVPKLAKGGMMAKGGMSDVIVVDVLHYPSKKRAWNGEINNQVLIKIEKYLSFVPNTKQEYIVKLKGASRGEYGINKEQGDKIIEILNMSM
jgi:hypothetical protein